MFGYFMFVLGLSVLYGFLYLARRMAKERIEASEEYLDDDSDTLVFEKNEHKDV